MATLLHVKKILHFFMVMRFFSNKLGQCMKWIVYHGLIEIYGIITYDSYGISKILKWNLINLIGPDFVRKLADAEVMFSHASQDFYRMHHFHHFKIACTWHLSIILNNPMKKLSCIRDIRTGLVVGIGLFLYNQDDIELGLKSLRKKTDTKIIIWKGFIVGRDQSVKNDW